MVAGPPYKSDADEEKERRQRLRDEAVSALEMVEDVCEPIAPSDRDTMFSAVIDSRDIVSVTFVCVDCGERIEKRHGHSSCEYSNEPIKVPLACPHCGKNNIRIGRTYVKVVDYILSNMRLDELLRYGIDKFRKVKEQ